MAKDDENLPAPLFGSGGVSITDTDALVQSMEETVDVGARGGDFSYMSFSGKRGRYTIGMEKREPGEDEPFLVAITLMSLGWMCWKGGKVEARRMAKLTEPPIASPDMDQFGPFEKDGDGWARARAIVARSLDNGEQIDFTITSKSGVAAFSDLQRDVLDRLKAGQPAWPVIVFGMEEFESQGYKNFKPILEVIKWVSTEDVQALAEEGAEPSALLEEAEEEKKAPPKSRRRL